MRSVFEDKEIEQAARTAHEVLRTYCRGLGNDTYLPWHNAPLWQIESTISGVKDIIKNQKMTPEESHTTWLKFKTSAGWVFGEKVDPVAMTHPCIISYEELPVSQKVKETLFILVVKGVLGIE